MMLVVFSLWIGDTLIAAAVGMFIFITTLAATAGAILPPFNKMRLDPALMSSPFITITDIAGVLSICTQNFINSLSIKKQVLFIFCKFVDFFV